MRTSSEELLTKLIAILATGETFSGENLGTQLSVSRASINSYIKRLIDLGIDVFSVPGKGYTIAHPINLLNLDEINRHRSNSMFELHVQPIVGSTNDELKQLVAATRPMHLVGVIAEAQTAGRGRHGRAWYSPFGASAYISLYWPLENGFAQAMGLSNAVGIAVARALEGQGLSGVELKWPNDVYVNGAKIAGVLIELEGQSNGVASAIIGIGVNIDLGGASAKTKIDQRWTDVRQELQEQVHGFTANTLPRNRIAASLIDCLEEVLKQFKQFGLAPFKAEWQQRDRFLGKEVKLISGDNHITGIVKGIDDIGALVLSIDGELKTFHGGELSLREVV